MKKNPKKFNESWNIGPNSTDITVKEVVEKIITKWGKGSWKEFDDDIKLHESNILKLDSSKIQNKLNWIQCLTIDEAIDYTVQWYKKFTEKNSYYTMKCIQCDTRSLHFSKKWWQSWCCFN